MSNRSSLSTLSDDKLLARLSSFIGNSRELLASVLDALIEVEHRRIHLRQSCPSMFVFCTQRLGFSEGAAFRRIAAARLVRRFPSIRQWLATGRVHLTTLARIRKHITANNIDSLLTEVAGKSRAHVDMVLARLAPRPDVRTSIRRLPATPVPTPLEGVDGEQPPPSTTTASHSDSEVEQISEHRFRVAFTASTELKKKLDWAKDLMAHSNPSRDVPTIVDRALDLLIAKLERDKFGNVERPRPSRPVTDPGAVNRATKREVVARDGMRCDFIGENGECCNARACLEFHHVKERALDGSGQAPNIKVYCRAHNQFAAEQTFGRDYIEKRIHTRRHKRTLARLKAALANRGFSEADTRRAIASADTRSGPLTDLLRDALAQLTPSPVGELPAQPAPVTGDGLPEEPTDLGASVRGRSRQSQ